MGWPHENDKRRSTVLNKTYGWMRAPTRTLCLSSRGLIVWGSNPYGQPGLAALPQSTVHAIVVQ